MLLLLIFSFLAGIVTILSPCILPILPIVLSSSLSGDKKRPIGVVIGFIFSFTFFTLFLSFLVSQTGISANALRNLSVLVIFLFGLGLLIPQFQKLLEKLFSALAKFTPRSKKNSGFIGGLLIGLSIGLLWTPCVGPILASVISLAISGSVSGGALLITLSYSIGTAIPMFAIVYGGRNLLNRLPILTNNTQKIQKLFGVLMILTALAIYFNYDRKFQSYILDVFPGYGKGLTALEDNEMVRNALDNISGSTDSEVEKSIGKPMFDLTSDLGSVPELIQGGEWFNSEPLTLESLRGKVVIIDFWTYTCINCIRTLPYLESWHDKYKNDGLVVIGVHTPEFEFEKSPENVKKAIEDFGITYPVMQDNEYSTWRAYNNRYWPAKYIIDKNGHIRYTHFGEGKYDETEKVIQELLSETGAEINTEIKNPQYQLESRTPETYLGYKRMFGYVNPGDIKRDQKALYNFSGKLSLNEFAYSGEWNVGSEHSSPSDGATLTFLFDSRDVFLVMRPKKEGLVGQVRVLVDGKIAAGSVGEDVENGIVTVDKDRLYEVIHLNSAGRHELILEFLDSNLELYAFTFG